VLADHKILGDLIREEREQRQLSQQSLAALAGLSRSFQGEVERGDANLSFASFLAISDGLDIRPSEMMRRYEIRLSNAGSTTD
jgi:transcriptional regulator with XRE-family HTH domain